MSERRRSLFVLLLVLGLIAASAFAVTSKSTKLGLDLQGGVQLVYQGQPTAQQPQVTQEALQRSLDIMRERVDAFGVSEPELLLSGQNQIEVNLPGVDNAERAAQQVGSTAQLFFYDWEKNILDESCKADPDENANDKTPITGFYKATKQAAKCPARTDGNNNAADAPRFYAFNKTSKQPFDNGQPSQSKAKALEDLDAGQKANAEVVEVPEGVLVVRDEKPSVNAPNPDRWWVISDDPGLSGTDIKDPKQSFNSTSRRRAGRPSTTSRARSRSVGRTTRCRATTRSTRPSTSRSCWTTSWSPRRTSTTASSRTGSTARAAPRSPAPSRSTRRRTWRRSSRSARCRSAWS
jgi:SecD/SecF fusion protein